MAGKREKLDKNVDALHDELLKGHRSEDIFDDGGSVQDLTRRLLERALEGEMTDRLGYEKHASEARNGGTSRNGKSRKRIKTGEPDHEVEVPRDQDGTFEPTLVPMGQRRVPGFDDKVVALYTHGMTTREIQGGLLEIYGVEVSPSLISAITDAVLDDAKAWQARPLDAVYPIVYLDAMHVKMRSSGHVQNTAVYVALAINLEGQKELLGMWIGESEGAKFWLSVLTELKNRTPGASTVCDLPSQSDPTPWLAIRGENTPDVEADDLGETEVGSERQRDEQLVAGVRRACPEEGLLLCSGEGGGGKGMGSIGQPLSPPMLEVLGTPI